MVSEGNAKPEYCRILCTIACSAYFPLNSKKLAENPLFYHAYGLFYRDFLAFDIRISCHWEFDCRMTFIHVALSFDIQYQRGSPTQLRRLHRDTAHEGANDNSVSTTHNPTPALTLTHPPTQRDNMTATTTTSPSTNSTLSVTLEALRQHVNAATATLAMNKMVDEEAVKALACSLQVLATRSYAALHEQEPPSAQEQGDCYDQEGITVVPLQVPGTVAQQQNPILFPYPFALAPYTSHKPGELHLAGTCAVAVFNIALAAHVQSFLCTSGDEVRKGQLLVQAKTLYLLAHDLLDVLDINPDGTLIQVYLAIANNLIELYTELDDKVEVIAWQKTLTESFWTVPPAKNSPVYRHFCNVSQCYAVAFE